MYSIKTKQKNSKKRLLIVLFIVLLATLIIGYLFYFTSSNPEPQKNDVARDESGVNLAPPTEQEKKAANDQKEQNIKRDEVVASNTQDTKPSIVIVDASQYGNAVEVRAYISNLYENGGTCSVTFTKTGLKINRSTPGFKDATTTQCTPITIPRAEFPQSGDWKYIVGYTSPNGTGTTSEKSITIQ